MAVSSSGMGTNKIRVIIQEILLHLVLGYIATIDCLAIQDHLGALGFQDRQCFLIEVLFNLIFGPGVGKNPGGHALAGAFAPFKNVPFF